MLECLACRTKVDYLRMQACLGLSAFEISVLDLSALFPALCYQLQQQRICTLISLAQSDVIACLFSSVQVKRLQKKLINFVQSQKIPESSIYNDEILDLYETHLTQAPKSQSQELSTDYSWSSSEYPKPEAPPPMALYAQYSWLKEKLQTKYQAIKESKLVGKVVEGLAPAREKIQGKIQEKRGRLVQGLKYVKEELRSLGKESPSFSEIRGIDIGGMLRAKYRDFF